MNLTSTQHAALLMVQSGEIGRRHNVDDVAFWVMRSWLYRNVDLPGNRMSRDLDWLHDAGMIATEALLVDSRAVLTKRGLGVLNELNIPYRNQVSA